MMNIRIDERHAYIEIEVYGAYQLERLQEVLDGVRGLSERHGGFSVLEIHFGKPQNLITAMSKLAGFGEQPEDYDFAKGLRKYALVSDTPSILIRLVRALSEFGRAAVKIFPSHERDYARQWIESASHEVTSSHTPIS